MQNESETTQTRISATQIPLRSPSGTFLSTFWGAKVCGTVLGFFLAEKSCVTCFSPIVVQFFGAEVSDTVLGFFLAGRTKSSAVEL